MKKPKEPKEPTFVRQTLAWCNRYRKKKGKEPLARLPRGEQGNPYSCPCGKATGLCVRNISFEEEIHGHVMCKSNPPYVYAFVSAFDSGELPQYEL